MKLVINIPCYNEEETLPLVLDELPRQIPGIAEIEVQIVDDGSTDQTAQVAAAYGCRVIRHNQNLGLGNTFNSGIQAALANGCDLMVNIDADYQHPPKDVPRLVSPILTGEADIVVANRTPWKIEYYSRLKRFLQLVGNKLVGRIVGQDVPDTVCGFRAYSREALLRINVITKYSYTLDTLVQASKKGLRISSVPITANPPTRKSRLSRNLWSYTLNSAINVARIFVVYEPFLTFFISSLLFLVPGLFLLVRFIVFALQGGSGRVQSLVVSATMLIIAGILFVLGVLAGVLSINRYHLEEQLYLTKRQFYEK